MHEERIDRLHAIMGFVVLAAIMAGEIALILKSFHVQSMPLPHTAQIFLHLTFGR